MTDHPLAVSCEALKCSYRQSKEGFVISFVIDPHNMPPELALAPIGTRVMLAVAEIVPEEQQATGAREAPSEPEEATRKVDTTRSERAKASYRMSDDGERAVTRAAMLCGEEQFQDWLLVPLGDFDDLHGIDQRRELTALRLRDRLHIQSRSEIATDERAYAAFLALEAEYKAAVGQMAEIR